MKQYVIKKGSHVFGYKNGKVVNDGVLQKDVTFDQTWFVKYGDCEKCQCGTKVAQFKHKIYDFLTADANDVVEKKFN